MKALVINNQSRSMAIFWRTLIQRMAKAGIEPCACVPAGDPEAEETLKKAGARVVNYKLDRKGLNPLADLATLAGLKKIIADQKPDLVFASTIKPVIYASLAAKSLHVPGIFATITGLGYVFEEDTPLKKLIHWIGAGMYRRALANIDGVYFQNRDDAALFASQKIISPHQRALFAPGTGVNTDFFTPQAFPEKGPVFLLAGRLLEAKGIADYARAAAMLKKKYPESRFQLLGIPEEGPGSYPLDKVLRHQAEGVLEYLGQTRDVRPCLAAAHVAVLPSWREGAPTALMEAMAMGRPCVATDVPGCRDVLLNGKTGWLCKPRDPDSLAAAMERFILEPESIREMGAQGRLRAENEYDASKIADKIIAEMTAILRSKRMGVHD